MASQYRRRSLMLNTIAKVAQGNPTIITDSSSRRLKKLNVYGQSSQDGEPSVENPIPIISKEVSEIKVTGANLFDFVTLAGGEGATFEKNGLSARIENGYLITTGTAINDAFTNILIVYVPMDKQTIFPAGTYQLGRGDKGMSKLTIGVTTVSGKGPTNYGQAFTIDEPFYISYFYIAYALGQNANGEKIPLMMVNGNESINEFEPYKEQIINITEPITLRGIPVSSGGNVTIDGQQYIADYIDSLTGKVNRLNGYVDSYNGEEVGTIFMSTTGQLTTGAKVIYKLSQPTQEDLPQQDQEAIRALTTYYPNTVIQTGCWNEVTYSAKRVG